LEGIPVMQVFVRDNDINSALRVLKRKMQREGTFREMKRRRAYEKPSERRVREKAEAIRRHRKMLRKRLEREGYWSVPASAEMDYLSTNPPLPAEYYRRNAARARQLASEATTAGVKAHLREVALQYERLAERADNGTVPASP
jgi:small subunit ribosomal protein S21